MDKSLKNALVTVFAAVVYALAILHEQMTVTDPDHIYEGDFVVCHSDSAVHTGEVVGVHTETNKVSVNVWHDDSPTMATVEVPASRVELHPDGRMVSDDACGEDFECRFDDSEENDES